MTNGREIDSGPLSILTVFHLNESVNISIDRSKRIYATLNLFCRIFFLSLIFQAFLQCFFRL